MIIERNPSLPRDDTLDNLILKELHKNSLDESSEDKNRVEMCWTSKHEEYLTEIKNGCLNLSIIYELKAKKYNRLYFGLTIPTVIIPIVIGSINPFLTISYVSSIIMCSSGVLSGVITFIKPNERSAKYSEYSLQYNEIADMIETELIKPKKFRDHPSLFIERIHNKKTLMMYK